MKKETDFRIYLCDIADSLLQGGPLELEGNTYVGDEARKKGMHIVDLIRVLDVYFKRKDQHMEDKITFDDEMLNSVLNSSQYDTHGLDVTTLRTEVTAYLAKHPHAIEPGLVYTYDGKPLGEHDKKLLFLITYLMKLRGEDTTNYYIDPDVTAEERLEIIKQVEEAKKDRKRL